ncbi:MAG TPA: TetR/AcrR family transcriptional regulator [Marmoricola sp.]|jgi:AcrR family transcriptional regulator
MAGKRAAQKRRTRRLLIDSGLRAFQEKGYAAATVDDIASGAGTTRTTFYLHFSSKIELLQATLVDLDQLVARTGDVSLEKVAAAGDRDLIRSWIQKRFELWPELIPRVRAAFQAAAVEPEIAVVIQAWFEAAISEIHAGLDAADRFEPESRHVRGVLAFGQIEFLSRRWAVRGWDETVDREAALETLTHSWAALLAE